MSNTIHVGRLLRCLALSAVVIVLVLILASTDLVLLAEKHLEDVWYRIHSETRTEDRIVIIEIDDETLEYYFPEIPLPRGQIALLLDELARPVADAKTVVLDLYFEGPDKSDPGDDTLLAYIISLHRDRVVCALYLPDVEFRRVERSAIQNNLLQKFSYQLQGIESPVADEARLPLSIFLSSADYYGHIDVFQDETNVPRELPLFIRSDGAMIGALAIEAVRNYLDNDRSSVTFDGHSLSLAEHRIPLDESGTMKIRYFKHTAGYTRYSMLDLLEQFKEGEVTPTMFRDKIVLVGISSKTYFPKEFCYDPFGRERPNVYLHADIISSILSDSYMSPADRSVLPLLSVIIGLAFCLIHMLNARLPRLAISLSLILCIVVADFVLFQLGVALGAVPLLLISLPMSVYTYFVSFREQVDIIKVKERETLTLREKEKSLVELEKEIQVARAIQEQLLPESVPSLPGFDIYGINIPAKGVSGDFFDFISLSEDSLAIIVADVSGKGISASLLMAASQAVLRSESLKLDTSRSNIANILEAANNLIFSITGTSRFVTLFYSVLDVKGNSFSYVNAGHNRPICIGSNGAVSYLEAGGIVLGVIPDARYESHSVGLQKGEKVVIYSDGVIEATDTAGEHYGEERLVELLRNNRTLPSRHLTERIVDDVIEFTGGADQSDDITLVVLGTAC